ncbi:MAG: hypothetical protein QM668_04430 [Agriterribacter sp.]
MDRCIPALPHAPAPIGITEKETKEVGKQVFQYGFPQAVVKFHWLGGFTEWLGISGYVLLSKKT